MSKLKVTRLKCQINKIEIRKFLPICVYISYARIDYYNSTPRFLKKTRELDDIYQLRCFFIVKDHLTSGNYIVYIMYITPTGNDYELLDISLTIVIPESF